jgi:nitrate/nitrite transport system substrate-binding protein
VVHDPASPLGPAEDDPDYLAVAKSVNQIDLYKDAAAMTKTPLPKEVMRSSKLMDGTVWDGKNPAAYAQSFKIKVSRTGPARVLRAVR